jgi:hypothetical protein
VKRFTWVLTLGALSLVGTVAVGAAPADEATARRTEAPPASGDVAAWVDRKVAQCAPKPEERRFDQTGWLTDIRSALALAKEHNRPVFLFTHDGRMGLGRC